MRTRAGWVKLREGTANATTWDLVVHPSLSYFVLVGIRREDRDVVEAKISYELIERLDASAEAFAAVLHDFVQRLDDAAGPLRRLY